MPDYWHYTTGAAMPSIMRQGLRPYDLNHGLGRGIYLWERPQDGWSELGIAVQRIADHRDPVVVRLRVSLPNEPHEPSGAHLRLYHNGHFTTDQGEVPFHAREPARVARRRIPARLIQAEWVIDMLAVLGNRPPKYPAWGGPWRLVDGRWVPSPVVGQVR